MTRLLATVGEGHTSLNASPDAYFPLVTRWFGPEGSRELRVVQALPADAAALGDEAIAVGGLPLSTVLPLLDECLSVEHPDGFAPQEPAEERPLRRPHEDPEDLTHGSARHLGEPEGHWITEKDGDVGELQTRLNEPPWGDFSLVKP